MYLAVNFARRMCGFFMNSGNKSIDTDQTVELANWLHARIDNIELPSEMRKSIGVALLQQSLDLVEGSILLLRNNLPGAALTLMRPIFEAYVRGIWALHCATEYELCELAHKSRPTKWRLNDFIKDIDEKELDQIEWIERISKSIPAMNDLVHGGSFHLLGRIKDGVVEPDYRTDWQQWLVEEGIEVRIAVACELFEITGDEHAVAELQNYLAQNFGWNTLK